MARENGVWLLTAVWLSAIGAGLWLWERYDTTPGAAGTPAALENAPTHRWQLTVFVHPRCPCSRATLVELAQLAAAAPDLSVRIRFVVPRGVGSGWAQGPLWVEAGRMPGVSVDLDPDGAQARLFGAETSGHAALTAPDGVVVFSGGLTPGRGRPGEGLARRAVLGWMRGRTGASTAPVFGCELLPPGA
ncbi:hypothetical protein R5W23_005288 [Gemmata sp. JC673]|uniref:RedB protein n=1 Tax=Gemmata algarum TaxID=2975278 RepID=A0ABU5FAA4_9BACT|nr:hypothetical protein [Gemmata algarum]MDY3563672.1 hypothetical protein [Gemmata algarum]